jgi:hypothetical protein
MGLALARLMRFLKEMNMKRAITHLAAVGLLFGSLGCNQSPEGGVPDTEKSFTLSGPVLATDIKQGGGPIPIDLKIKPDDQFTETVRFSASEVEGLDVTFEPTEVKPADPKNVKMMVTAEKDAPLGEKKVTVTAKPSSGQAVSIDVTIKVEEVKRN